MVLICLVLIILPVQYYPFFSVHEQINKRMDLFRQIEHRRLQNALIFVASPSGDMTQGDLIRNLPDFKNASVIFAWDLGERNGELMSVFPDRESYRYAALEQTGLKVLLPIHPRSLYN